MAKKLVIAAFLALISTGCGSEPSPSTTASGPTGFSMPALPGTLEGELQADVAEGEVDEEGYSEYNFGVLVVGSEHILVEVSGEVLRSAGLPDGFGAVVATIGSGPTATGHYKITALRRK